MSDELNNSVGDTGGGLDGNGSGGDDGDGAGSLVAALAEPDAGAVLVEEKKPLNRSTIVTFVVLVLGVGGVWFMYQRTGPKSAAAASKETVAAKQTINNFLSGGSENLSLDRGSPIAIRSRAMAARSSATSGNGVAPSLTAGKILASSALRRDDEWSGSQINSGVPARFPPEPIRFVGGLVVRAAVRRKERREDVGKSVDPLRRCLSRDGPLRRHRFDHRPGRGQQHGHRQGL